MVIYEPTYVQKVTSRASDGIAAKTWCSCLASYLLWNYQGVGLKVRDWHEMLTKALHRSQNKGKVAL